MEKIRKKKMLAWQYVMSTASFSLSTYTRARRNERGLISIFDGIVKPVCSLVVVYDKNAYVFVSCFTHIPQEGTVTF